jgi:hypothetical protein
MHGGFELALRASSQAFQRPSTDSLFNRILMHSWSTPSIDFVDCMILFKAFFSFP